MNSIKETKQALINAVNDRIAKVKDTESKLQASELECLAKTLAVIAHTPDETPKP